VTEAELEAVNGTGPWFDDAVVTDPLLDLYGSASNFVAMKLALLQLEAESTVIRYGDPSVAFEADIITRSTMRRTT